MSNIKIKIKAKLRRTEIDPNAENGMALLEGLDDGLYVVTLPDGTAAEIVFEPGNRSYQLRNAWDSEYLNQFFNSDEPAIFIKSSANSNTVQTLSQIQLSQLFLRATNSHLPEVSHCVGKDGLCRLIRAQAEKYYMKHKVEKPYGGVTPECYLRGANRKNYRLKLKMAEELETLFFSQYPTGCTLEQLTQICLQYKMKGTIRFPYIGVHEEINAEEKHPQLSFKFINVATDHLELVMDEAEIQILEEEQFERQYLEAQQTALGEGKIRNNLLRVYRSGMQVYAYCYNTVTYVSEPYSTFWNPDHPYSQWYKAAQQYRISSECPYYYFIKYATRIPTHWNNGVWTNKAAMNKKGVSTEWMWKQREIHPDLWGQDMTAAYVQWNQCPYFRHFASFPNMDAYDPTPEQYLENEGWWYVESDSQVPIWGNIGGFWTSQHLRHFHNRGWSFRVKYGIWSTSKADIPDMPVVLDSEGKRCKKYVINIGRLAHEGKRLKEYWYDRDNLLERPEDAKTNLKVQCYNRKKWTGGWLIASQIYAAASIQIVERALDMKCKIYGIKIDCIYTDRPFPATKLFKKSEPLDIANAQKTIWTDSIVNNYFLSANADDAWKQFPVPWLPKPKPKLKFEHDPRLFPKGICHLAGPAGAGKTTLLGCLQHLDPLYITPTIRLRDDKADLFRRRTCMAGCPQLYSYTNGVRPSIIIIDEIGMIGGKCLSQHIQYALDHDIRLFLLGDQAQIRSLYSLRDLWKTMQTFPTINFTIIQRAKNAKTQEFLAKIHTLAMYDLEDNDRVIYDIRKLVRQYLIPANKSDRKTLPVICYHNKNEDAVTIDKFQGQTIKQGTKTVIVFQSGGGRKDVMHKIIFTMVSRFEDIDDIRYYDTSYNQSS